MSKLLYYTQLVAFGALCGIFTSHIGMEPPKCYVFTASAGILFGAWLARESAKAGL